MLKLTDRNRINNDKIIADASWLHSCKAELVVFIRQHFISKTTFWRDGNIECDAVVATLQNIRKLTNGNRQLI